MPDAHGASAGDTKSQTARLTPSRLRVTPARVTLCVITWVVCLAAAAALGLVTSWGMVVLPITSGNGIHAGDLVIGLVAVVVAGGVSLVVLRPPRR